MPNTGQILVTMQMLVISFQTGQSTQTDCAIGTYQATTGQSSCCDADAGTMLTKQVNPLKLHVLHGTYQPDTGQIL